MVIMTLGGVPPQKSPKQTMVFCKIRVDMICKNALGVVFWDCEVLKP
jgi:hypothetical protein